MKRSCSFGSYYSSDADSTDSLWSTEDDEDFVVPSDAVTEDGDFTEDDDLASEVSLDPCSETEEL